MPCVGRVGVGVCQTHSMGLGAGGAGVSWGKKSFLDV